MTILLQWLVDQAWIFYLACGLGVIVYVLRALAARRECNMAVFTLERETAAARAAQSWVMVVVFVVIAVLIFVSTTYILPTLPIYGAGAPPPTATLAAGVEPSAPAITLTPSPTLGPLVVTATPTATTTSELAPAAELTEAPAAEEPTLEPTETPEFAVSGQVGARFGDLAELVGYALRATEFTAAEPLSLTLYWQKLEGTPSVNYLVFTHLLAPDGRLIAQHDGAPAGGTRPLDTWTPDETIVDVHPLAFYDVGYVGPARIAVGLYDPAVGRVPTTTGDDRVILPITVNIAP